ncbi:MAG: hypothetical protein KGN34_13655 [Sphingomonadales bacterium]|nr:hypothetical protein [Sphingomonadales bacterium]
MNAHFAKHSQRLPTLFQELMAGPEYPLKARAEWRGIKAIYVFFENGRACHVGRTRNLRQRLAGHVSNSHFSATFAFRQARLSMGINVTYRMGEGRKALMQRHDFQEEFGRQRRRLSTMTLRFLEVEDPIDQYLLELYAALELGTSLEEFETS